MNAIPNGYETIIDRRESGRRVVNGTEFPIITELVGTNWIGGSCLPAARPVFVVRSHCGGITTRRRQFRTLEEARSYFRS